MASFYIENFGCRATQADGAALERQFLQRGLARAGTPQDAEIVVLNTCTVTAGADKDARAAVRRLRRNNPDCKILVTGCYAQRAPEEVAALPGVTWVVGNSHKHQAAEIAVGSGSSMGSLGFFSLEQLSNSGVAAATPALHVGDIFAHTELMAAPVFEAANERTRPNLKVQDGCNNRCSFCVIPFVRGQSRSLSENQVLAEVRTLVEAGYREVVISGINLGRWGRDLRVLRPSSFVLRETKSKETFASSIFGAQPDLSEGHANDERQGTKDEGRRTKVGLRLVDLIHAILSETAIEKLRISSVEPMDWTDELIELMAKSPRIAKHAHVPMQSGSDAVLRRMHRKYRPWHYREKIAKIRNQMPYAAIGADVMVGFPEESAQEFAETQRMVEELPFTYLHVFTYSARPGTPAAQHNGQVPTAVARERNGILREIASAKKRAFMESLVGREVDAITLQMGGGGFTEALTENYLKVRIPGWIDANLWLRLRIEAVSGEVLEGAVSGKASLSDFVTPHAAFSDGTVTRECTC